MREIPDHTFEEIKQKLDRMKSLHSEIEDRNEDIFLKEDIENLGAELHSLRILIENLPSAGTTPAGESASASAAEGAERAGHRGQPIASFFETVGQGVVDAQRRLDRQSLDYMAQARGFPPTMFRLPKASAEIQFGIEDVSTEGFNIFIATSEDTRRESMQHKVSFDIVSSPLPPETMAEIGARTVAFPFVGDPLAREAVRRRLIDFAASGRGTQVQADHAREIAQAESFDRWLVLALERAWALLRPEATEPPHLEVAYLDESGADFDRKRGKQVYPGLHRVIALMQALTEEQRAARRPAALETG